VAGAHSVPKRPESTSLASFKEVGRNRVAKPLRATPHHGPPPHCETRGGSSPLIRRASSSDAGLLPKRLLVGPRPHRLVQRLVTAARLRGEAPLQRRRASRWLPHCATPGRDDFSVALSLFQPGAEDGRRRTIEARHVEGDIREFTAHEVGSPFVVGDSAGEVALRDRGQITASCKHGSARRRVGSLLAKGSRVDSLDHPDRHSCSGRPWLLWAGALGRPAPLVRLAFPLPRRKARTSG
jgi:hypothetical protein